jgi:hypothetical protein
MRRGHTGTHDYLSCAGDDLGELLTMGRNDELDPQLRGQPTRAVTLVVVDGDDLAPIGEQGARGGHTTQAEAHDDHSSLDHGI